MAQEEYGPYVKEKRKFSIGKFVKYVLLVTFTLAVIEVVVIYFFISEKKENKQPTSAVTAIPDETHEIITDTFTYNNHVVASIADTQVSRPVTDTATGYSMVKPILTPSLAQVQITSIDTAAKPIETKPVERNLTSKDMQAIVKRIQDAMKKVPHSSNCIQIRKTSTSNVTNAFKLAEHLKKQGFIIGGRLTVSGSRNGVGIDAGQDCITVTVGTM